MRPFESRNRERLRPLPEPFLVFNDGFVIRTERANHATCVSIQCGLNAPSAALQASASAAASETQTMLY